MYSRSRDRCFRLCAPRLGSAIDSDPRRGLRAAVSGTIGAHWRRATCVLHRQFAVAPCNGAMARHNAYHYTHLFHIHRPECVLYLDMRRPAVSRAWLGHGRETSRQSSRRLRSLRGWVAAGATRARSGPAERSSAGPIRGGGHGLPGGPAECESPRQGSAPRHSRWGPVRGSGYGTRGGPAECERLRQRARCCLLGGGPVRSKNLGGEADRRSAKSRANRAARCVFRGARVKAWVVGGPAGQRECATPRQGDAAAALGGTVSV
jgi:hypothetical protein